MCSLFNLAFFLDNTHLKTSLLLLQVNDEVMTGVSHTKAVTTIRKTKGLVHLVVSRPSDQNPNTYLAYLPINADKCNGNTGTRGDLTHQLEVRFLVI